MNKVSFYIVIVLFLISCRQGLLYEEFQKTDVKAWTAKDTIRFSFSSKDVSPKDLTIVLRNTGAYEKANLWLFLQLQSPDGQIEKDTLDCTLADDYGYWLGSGFSGKYETEHLLYGGKAFAEGEWTLFIEQAMRQDAIKGISEVGLLITKTK